MDELELSASETPTSVQEPLYPRHPFSLQLCEIIVRMPEGFNELAAEGLLSVQLMRRLAMNGSQIVLLMSEASSDRKKWSKLLLRLTPLERIIWFAFLVFYIRSDTYQADHEDLVQALLAYDRQPLRPSLSKAEVYCALWGGCLVLGLPEFENGTEPSWRSDIRKLLEKHIKSLRQLNEVVSKFLWSEYLSESVSCKLPHLQDS